MSTLSTSPSEAVTTFVAYHEEEFGFDAFGFSKDPQGLRGVETVGDVLETNGIMESQGWELERWTYSGRIVVDISHVDENATSVWEYSIVEVSHPIHGKKEIYSLWDGANRAAFLTEAEMLSDIAEYIGTILEVN